VLRADSSIFSGKCLAALLGQLKCECEAIQGLFMDVAIGES
jgi:hypothetical protein